MISPSQTSVLSSLQYQFNALINKPIQYSSSEGVKETATSHNRHQHQQQRSLDLVFFTTQYRVSEYDQRRGWYESHSSE